MFKVRHFILMTSIVVLGMAGPPMRVFSAVKTVEREESIVSADKTILNSLIAVAATKRQSEYTPDTWAIFTAILEQARAVFAKPNATQGEVDSAISQLQSAIFGLKKIK